MVVVMPRKIRELVQGLTAAGFREIPGGKGSHRKFFYPRFRGAVTLSGKSGDDAKPYQEKPIQRASEEVQE
jgi:predicted RNA binding protein YcfA (HicA-like mRNA interferase family)